MSYLIKRPQSPFAGLVTKASVIRQFSSPNDIFIAMKRRDCLAAVAPAGVLKTVMGALVRDGVDIEVEAGTISDEEVAGWKVLATMRWRRPRISRKRIQPPSAVVRRNRQPPIRNRHWLDAQRAKNDETARREKLEAVRKQIASKANAVVDGFAKHLQRHMDSVAAEVRDTPSAPSSGTVLSAQDQAAQQVKYSGERMDWATPWVSQFAKAVKEGWEYGAVQTSLEDYGQAQWHSRTIEAISVRVNLSRING